VGELLDQPARDRGGEQGVAARHDADPVGQLLGRHVLEQEAARARAQRVVDVLVEVEGREHENGDGVLVIALGDDAPRRLEAVDAGHPYVHQHDVGPPLAHEVDRVRAIAGLAGDDDAGLGVEDRSEAGAHERLVIRDQDRDGPLGDRLMRRLVHAPTLTARGVGRHPSAGSDADRPAG